MTINEYQRLAGRTIPADVDARWQSKVTNGVMGLCGEAGECIDIAKKWMFQGHELDKEKLAEELGDTLWYAAELASGLGLTLEKVMADNIAKLQRRYPDGFEAERSVYRGRFTEDKTSGLVEDDA